MAEENKNDFWIEDLNEESEGVQKPTSEDNLRSGKTNTSADRAAENTNVAEETPQTPPQNNNQTIAPTQDTEAPQKAPEAKPEDTNKKTATTESLLDEKTEVIPEEKEQKNTQVDTQKVFVYDAAHTDIQMVAVIRAYFAKKKEKAKTTVTNKNYTIVKGDTRHTIAKKNKGVKKNELPKTLTPGQTISLRIHETKKEVFFEKINSAVIGAKVYIVVETSGLKDTELAIRVLGSNNITFVGPDEQVKVLVQEEEKTTVNVQVGNYAGKKEYINASGLANKAIAEVKLRPKDDKERKDWGEKIKESTEKEAYLHLEVTAITDKKVLYCNEDIKESDKDTCFEEKGVFLNKQGLWFILKGCFCEKELDTEDLVMIGISEKNAEKYLEGINQTVGNYDINTCMRLAHFMAQVRHESLDFVYQKEIWGPTAAQSGYEGRADLGNNQPGDGKRFMGRGLIQITGRTNYTNYGTYKGEDFVTEPNNEKLETIPYCIDSAGWYWSAYLDVNLNTYADKDDAIYCTYRINGGFNGYRDRENKVRTVFRALKYCINTDLSTKGVYNFPDSRCYDIHDAVYKWANLLYGEGKSAEASDNYQRYLDLTDNVKQTKKIKARRIKAANRILPKKP